ncbi:peptidoglycan/LPS O-acetylase OafA/YrhL [Pseudomonas sp. TE36184]|uniref:acyltransferase family protein n=1 Tax=Pseudomonas veronii TaxID=76761 RepID=UPI0021C0DB96|nr:acyltransferase family protein [Pseudomonas veronii]MCT9823034.1 acyltransferase [Pseudomonas veronii]
MGTIYRPDIDGLRAVAVLAVVLFHAFPSSITGGFVGVDIFFVISGFLISTIIFGGLEEHTFSFTDFYRRRINRIFPALIIVFISCWCFGWFSLFADEYAQLGKHILGGAFFSSNVILLNEVGYFDNLSDSKILLNLWSLGVEEQFYLLWPLLAFSSKKIRLNYATPVITITLISFGLNIHNATIDPASDFYTIQNRAWELLAGALLALIKLQHPHFFPPLDANHNTLPNMLSVSGALLVTFSFIAIDKHAAFPSWWAVVPTTGAVLILAAGPHAWLNKVVLSNRPMVWIGLISFPLYLWHWPILTFARLLENGLPSWQMRASLVTLSVVLAWLTYNFIEHPIRHSGHKSITPLLVVAMLSVASLGYFTNYSNGLPNRPIVEKSERALSQLVGPIWKYASNEQCLNRYPFEESKTYGWWFCVINRDAEPTVLLYGNSFANHLYPGLVNNEKLRGNTILSIGVCGIAGADKADGTPEIGGWPCSGGRPRRQEIFIHNIVRRSKPIEYVIIDGFPQVFDGDYIKSVKQRIAFLLDNNKKVIIFKPHLTFDYNVKGCFTRSTHLYSGSDSQCSIGLEKLNKLEADFAPLENEIKNAFPTVQFFDQNSMYCDDTQCSMVIDGMPVFRDEYYHYSEYASSKLADLFVTWATIHAPGILKK